VAHHHGADRNRDRKDRQSGELREAFQHRVDVNRAVGRPDRAAVKGRLKERGRPLARPPGARVGWAVCGELPNGGLELWHSRPFRTLLVLLSSPGWAVRPTLEGGNRKGANASVVDLRRDDEALRPAAQPRRGDEDGDAGPDERRNRADP